MGEGLESPDTGTMPKATETFEGSEPSTKSRREWGWPGLNGKSPCSHPRRSQCRQTPSTRHWLSWRRQSAKWSSLHQPAAITESLLRPHHGPDSQSEHCFLSVRKPARMLPRPPLGPAGGSTHRRTAVSLCWMSGTLPSGAQEAKPPSLRAGGSLCSQTWADGSCPGR